MSDDVEDYYRKHCAMPGGVILVIMAMEDGSEQTEVFTSIEKARAWADDFGDVNNTACAVFSPRVIDMPEFGNIEEGHLH